MRFIILAFILNWIPQFAFSQLPEFANFSVTGNREIIWKKVYERNGVSADSLKQMVYDNIRSNSSLEIDNNDSLDLIVKMKQMVFEKKGDYFDGNLTINFKDGRYRVVLSGVRRFLGIKRMNAAAFAGVSQEVKNGEIKSGYRLEDTYLNKQGNSLTGKSGLEYYNELFKMGFDFNKVAKKKDDW